MLTVIRKCFDEVSQHYQENLTLATIPQEDPPTYAMIQKAATVEHSKSVRAQMSCYLAYALTHSTILWLKWESFARSYPRRLDSSFLRRRRGLDL